MCWRNTKFIKILFPLQYPEAFYMFCFTVKFSLWSTMQQHYAFWKLLDCLDKKYLDFCIKMFENYL